MFPVPPLDVRPEVASALRAGRPVVALGSAPIAHSLPWPENLEAARRAEAAARQEGATLAVVAVWQGRLTVGLSAAELEALAQGASTLRASRRDLLWAVARGTTAAPTVAASLYLAQRAGIRLVATGAIGGAARLPGRDEEQPWGVSADLVELSRTPVAVVSAGARSVLSVALTAEILESYSVPVVGYGTDLFPTFYLRVGGHRASGRTDSPEEAAALLAAHWGMGGAGVVLANLTPEEVALSPDELHSALLEVEDRAKKARLQARDLPQSLMGRLNRLTKGKALRAYQAILVDNARLAARVARELAGRDVPGGAIRTADPATDPG
jgi:pseudouridine-5'-phosphate glycosidase